MMTHHLPTGVLLAALCLPLAACSRHGPSSRRSAAAASESAAAAAPARVDSALVIPRSSLEPTASPSAGEMSGAGGAGSAGSDPVARASGPPAGPVAVVLLMLGNPGEPKELAGAPRTYKLLLTADARTATIEVDDHPIGTAPVQRVYPQRAPPGATTPPRPGWPQVSVRAAPGPTQALPPRRSPRPFAPPPQSADSAFRFPGDRDPVHADTLTPNGAPIID